PDRKDRESAMEQIYSLCELMFGGVDVDESGLLRFVPWEAGAAPLRHFGGNDYADFEQAPTENYVTKMIAVGRAFNGTPLNFYIAEDMVAEEEIGWPDADGDLIPKIMQRM